MKKKYNLLIPIAGLGSRFVKENYFLPKPLILVNNRSIIEWTMDCVDHSNCNIIFIVRREHIVDFNIDGYLRAKFGNDITIIEVDKTTEGAVCSCLLAESHIDNDLPLIIHCSDIYFEPKFDPASLDGLLMDGVILTFKSNSKNYSYVELNEESVVTKTAEKQVISPNAAVGIYWYKRGSDFVKYAKNMIQRNIRTNNEFFICPLYNIFIENGHKILTKPVEKMHVFGTPEELRFFVNNSLRTWPDRKHTVALCSDHSGFETKEEFKKILTFHGISYVDFGVHDKTIDRDYYEYVHAAADAVTNGQCNFGFGFCRSGQGVNITANKMKGIRSAWVNDGYLAEMAIRHNCCNFFSLPAKYNTADTFRDIALAWKNSTFDGGRHQQRVYKIETL